MTFSAREAGSPDISTWRFAHSGRRLATGWAAIIRNVEYLANRICCDSRELVEEVSRHETVLESLQVGKPDSSRDERFRQRVEHWKESALGFLPEIYTLRRAISLISQRYFDGHEALFPRIG